jgi:carbonic anhydrase
MSVGHPVFPAALDAGYRRFRASRYPAERERWRKLGDDGQRPATMVIACSDSRSGPEAVFDAGPGELFVVRNVAGLVPVHAPDRGSHAASAALEFGVIGLEVRSIVVLGHGRCGGIKAALEGSPKLSATDFLGTWVAPISALAAEVDAAGPADGEGRVRALEHRSVERSIENLRTFPWIAARETGGSLTLHGAWFDIALGELHVIGEDGWAPLAVS